MQLQPNSVIKHIQQLRTTNANRNNQDNFNAQLREPNNLLDNCKILAQKTIDAYALRIKSNKNTAAIRPKPATATLTLKGQLKDIRLNSTLPLTPFFCRKRDKIIVKALAIKAAKLQHIIKLTHAKDVYNQLRYCNKQKMLVLGLCREAI